jgi:hypothetical protein
MTPSISTYRPSPHPSSWQLLQGHIHILCPTLVIAHGTVSQAQQWGWNKGTKWHKQTLMGKTGGGGEGDGTHFPDSRLSEFPSGLPDSHWPAQFHLIRHMRIHSHLYVFIWEERGDNDNDSSFLLWACPVCPTLLQDSKPYNYREKTRVPGTQGLLAHWEKQLLFVIGKTVIHLD